MRLCERCAERFSDEVDEVVEQRVADLVEQRFEHALELFAKIARAVEADQLEEVLEHALERAAALLVEEVLG